MTDRSVDCPVCGAKADQRCSEPLKLSLSWGRNHRARDLRIKKREDAAPQEEN